MNDMNVIGLMTNTIAMIAKEFTIDRNEPFKRILELHTKNTFGFAGGIQQRDSNSSSIRSSCFADGNDDDFDFFIYNKFAKKRKKEILPSPAMPFADTQISNVHKDYAVPDTNAILMMDRHQKQLCQPIEDDDDLDDDDYEKQSFFKFLCNCDDFTFQAQFKITRKTFQKFTEAMSPLIMEHKSITTFLSKTDMLLMGIWVLTSNESLKSIAKRFNTDYMLCYNSFVHLAKCIIKNRNAFQKWPSTIEQFKLLNDTFVKSPAAPKSSSSSSSSVANGNHKNDIHLSKLFGIIGCFEFENVINGVNKKYKIQCVCDGSGRFINVYVYLVKKNVSNYKVFMDSAVRTVLDTCNEDYFMIGNETYPLKPYLMKPYTVQKPNDSIKKFNNVLKGKCNIIENAFRYLEKRFLDIQNINMPTEGDIIYCIKFACVLHNFCIDQKDLFNDLQSNDNRLGEIQLSNDCIDVSYKDEKAPNINISAVNKRDSIMKLVNDNKN